MNFPDIPANKLPNTHLIGSVASTDAEAETALALFAKRHGWTLTGNAWKVGAMRYAEVAPQKGT